MSSREPVCLFVSDVHLAPGDAAKAGRFRAFLREAARRAGRLFILGDLFDFIAGPQHVALPEFRPVLDMLREAAAAGLRVGFIPGNRDYAGAEALARAARIELLPPRVEVRLGGRRVFLEHGDLLFNRNPRYFAYRRIAGARGIQRLWAGLPKALVVRFASGLRGVSRRDTPPSPFRTGADLLAAARPAFRRGADVVICGHLHRSADLRTDVEGRERRLIVLGEWRDGCPHARYAEGAFACVDR